MAFQELRADVYFPLFSLHTSKYYGVVMGLVLAYTARYHDGANEDETEYESGVLHSSVGQVGSTRVLAVNDASYVEEVRRKLAKADAESERQIDRSSLSEIASSASCLACTGVFGPRCTCLSSSAIQQETKAQGSAKKTSDASKDAEAAMMARAKEEQENRKWVSSWHKGLEIDLRGIHYTSEVLSTLK